MRESFPIIFIITYARSFCIENNMEMMKNNKKKIRRKKRKIGRRGS